MMKLTFVAVYFSLVLHVGYTTKCYSCREGSWLKGFPDISYSLSTCDPLHKAPSAECTSGVCWKLEGVTRNVKGVARLCGTSVGHCENGLNYEADGVKISCTSCKGENCNAAETTMSSMLVAPVLLILKYFT